MCAFITLPFHRSITCRLHYFLLFTFFLFWPEERGHDFEFSNRGSSKITDLTSDLSFVISIISRLNYEEGYVALSTLFDRDDKKYLCIQVLE